MIETFFVELPHGITLSCRAAGDPRHPAMVFLHGFPEAAFVWDPLLEHFAARGFRAVAPNLRGFEKSSAPADVSAYRAKHLVADIAALIARVSPHGAPLEALVAHDWGGAVAWNLANQRPALLNRLAIVNSPHPGTFLRELAHNPAQQAASAYMNFLVRPDAEALLAAHDFKRVFNFLELGGQPAWLTDAVREQYRGIWRGDGSRPGQGLTGGCNYYRASPLRPPTEADAAAAAIELPRSMLTIDVPTLVLWAMNDIALPPALVDGLPEYVPDLRLERVDDATHWIVHERPAFVAERIESFMLSK